MNVFRILDLKEKVAASCCASSLGIVDERVSREAINVYVTLSGTAVVTCCGRNAASYRVSTGTPPRLLQHGEAVELEAVVGACVCFLPNGECEWELSVVEEEEEEEEEERDAEPAGPSSVLNATLEFEPEDELPTAPSVEFLGASKPTAKEPSERSAASTESSAGGKDGRKRAREEKLCVRLTGDPPGSAWILELDGADVTVTVVKPVGDADSKTKTLKSAAEAKDFSRKVLEVKLGKGFTPATMEDYATCVTLRADLGIIAKAAPAVATRVAAPSPAPASSSAAAGGTGRSKVARVAAPVVEDGENTEGPSDSSDESDNDEALAPAAAPASDDDDEPIPLSVALDSKRSNAMAGYCFCLTGTLSTTRKQWTEIIYLNGGTAAPRVSKHVTHVVCGEADGQGTAKHTEALNRGIPTVDEQFMLRLIKRGGPRKPGATGGGAGAASSKDRDLKDGEEFEFPRQGGDPYVIKNIAGVYSCNCQAWKFQSKPINLRTCRHLKEFRGEDREIVRTQGDASAVVPRVAGARASAGFPGVLLAHNYTVGKPVVGYWMSEKLDGVRAYWNGKEFVSRQGNVFDAPDWFKRPLPAHPMDGELWAGRKMFQTTISIVRSAGSDRWKSVKYLVFDLPAETTPFEQRLDKMKEVIKAIGVDHVVLVEQTRVRDSDHLNKELDRVEKLGGEGLMLRLPGSKYEIGRSWSCLKVKTFHDAEALVVGHETGKGKHGDRLGALYCQLPDGKKFKVGSGFTDAERERPPKIGSVITFKYQELSGGGIPRFPTYVRIRTDVTWPPSSPWPPK